MSNQISLLDVVDKKTRRVLIPEVWKCMETCSNFSCTYPDGSIDRFPGTREPRCVNTDFESKLINNIWETKCKNYKWGD